MRTVPVTSTLLADRVRRCWEQLRGGGAPEASVLLAVVGFCRARVSRPELGEDWRTGLVHPRFPWKVPLKATAHHDWDRALGPLREPEVDWGALPVSELRVAREVLWADTQRFVGTHYTPPALAARLAAALLGAEPSWRRRVEPVVDPAVGTGALLVALAEVWLEAGVDPLLIAEALHGVDLDPLAVGLARVALFTLLGGDGWERRLRVGDALTGPPGPNPGAGLDWVEAFPGPMSNGGFGIVIANPPFGGERVRGGLGPGLRRAWPEVHGKADLTAYFISRIATILRPGARFGLIATNTLGQGHTRVSGLGRFMLDGTLSLGVAETDLSWPGAARVTVNVVVGARGPWWGARTRNGEPVGQLASNLQDEPEPPRSSAAPRHVGVCFEGVKLGDVAFLLPAAVARAWIVRDPSISEVLRPYLGGVEITDHAVPTASRYVIDLGAMSLDAARARWPELVQHMETHVQPSQRRSVEPGPRALWWRFARPRPALNERLAQADWVVVSPRVARHLIFVRLDLSGDGVRPVCSEQLNLFFWTDDARFGVLCSRVHELWARRHASTLETRLRYTPTTCFSTFVVPDRESLDRAGVGEAARRFEHKRDRLAVDHGVGLTRVYNALVGVAQRRLDPDGVRDLVRAKEELDRSVLRAYGWDDLALRVEAAGEGEAWSGGLVEEVIARLRASSASES